MAAIEVPCLLSPIFEEDETQLPTPPSGFVFEGFQKFKVPSAEAMEVQENLGHFAGVFEDAGVDLNLSEFILKKKGDFSLGKVNMSLPVASPIAEEEDSRSSQDFAANDVVEIYCASEKEWHRASVANADSKKKEIEVMFIHPESGVLRMQTMRLGAGTIRRAETQELEDEKLTDAELVEMLELLPGRTIEIQRTCGEWVTGKIMRVGKKAMLTRFHDKEKNVWEKVLPLTSKHIALLGTNLRKTQAKIQAARDAKKSALGSRSTSAKTNCRRSSKIAEAPSKHRPSRASSAPQSNGMRLKK